MNDLQKARRSERRHFWLGIFWVLNFPLVTAVFFLAPEFWKEASVLYLVYVSLYANAGTEFGARQASAAHASSESTWLSKLKDRIGL